MQSEHGPGVRRRQFDHRLVGLHLDQGLILGDGVTLGDEPLDDPPLVDALTDIWKVEYERHHAPFLFAVSEREHLLRRLDDSLARREVELFAVREREYHVETGHPLHRRLELE